MQLVQKLNVFLGFAEVISLVDITSYKFPITPIIIILTPSSKKKRNSELLFSVLKSLFFVFKHIQLQLFNDTYYNIIYIQ